MKVLQLRSSVGPFGAENVILELCKELSKTTYQPIIGIFNNTQNPHVELAEIAHNNHIETKIFTCHGPFDIRAILALCRFVRDEGIAIIHTHGYKANFYGLMAHLITHVPIIATCHPWLETDISFKAKCYTLLDKFCLHKFDRLVLVTQELKAQISKNGFSKNKISTIYNGIGVHRFKNLNKTDRNKIKEEFEEKKREIREKLGEIAFKNGELKEEFKDTPLGK